MDVELISKESRGRNGFEWRESRRSGAGLGLAWVESGKRSKHVCVERSGVSHFRVLSTRITRATKKA